MSPCLRFVAVLVFSLSASAVCEQVATYDPLRVTEIDSLKTVELTVADNSRRRDIPLLVYLPGEASPAPVLFFSHGLGGSRHGNAYLGKHWAGRGYLVVFVQHPGSDSSLLQGKRLFRGLRAMRKAVSTKNTLLRLQDIPAVLDQLAAWQVKIGHPLAGRLDLERVGMSGHSYGAVTTQALSGQRTPKGRALFTEARIDAAIALSPSTPKGSDAETAFGEVQVPWMLMTGTKDVSPIGGIPLESRLAVFPALPPGGKYQVVLHNAQHAAFGDRPLKGKKNQRNPNHHRVILALSTAFWDAWLREDRAARAWLDGEGPRALLEENDRWEKK